MAADDEDDVAPIYARVYTDFFKRDPQIYALGDIRFNKPKSLKSVGYTLALMLFYSFPMTMFVGMDKIFKNVMWATLIFGPPIALGSIMSKPLFHNKPLLKDIKSTFRYFSLAKTYTDLQSYDDGPAVRGDMTVWLADSDCYDSPESETVGRKSKRASRPRGTGTRHIDPRYHGVAHTQGPGERGRAGRLVADVRPGASSPGNPRNRRSKSPKLSR